jgi:adenylosuccinate synthase
MASKKKQAAKAGAGAVAAGKAVKDNAYVQRLVEDEDLRENLRTAFESARKAYERMANSKGPAKALMDDKKTQKQLRETATSLRDAADSLRGAKRQRKAKRRGGLLLLIAGVGVAFALNEGLRKKVLDALFGSEEEFEYSSTTSAGNSASPAPGAPATESTPPVGSTS